jgi:hypothetical protein
MMKDEVCGLPMDNPPRNKSIIRLSAQSTILTSRLALALALGDRH